MPREALEPGAFPPKDKVNPIKGADGVWRLTDIRHRTISGNYTRTSAQGRTSKECLEQFTRRWEVNRRKGSVRRRTNSAAPQFTLTDKMSDVFAYYDQIQRSRVEEGKLKWNSYDVYHRVIYPCEGYRAKADAIKLETELGGYSIGEIGQPAELHSYISDIADLSPTTAKHHHVILGAVFRILTLQGLYEVTPMREVPLPDVTAAKPQRALDEDERYGLMYMLGRREDWIDGHDYFLALGLTLLGTGIRPGEALALRWCDIPNLDDPEVSRAVVHVAATMVRRSRAAAQRQESRKAGEASHYWITLPQWLTRELRAWKSIRDLRADDDYLFTIAGEPLCPNQTNYPLRRLRQGTAMEWFTWGNLRDTVATEVAGRSGDQRNASAQLGHSEGSTLARQRYIDRRGFAHQVVDNSQWLEFLYPGENNGKVTILGTAHAALAV